MIKFNCIIHKETGTVIKYEDWKAYVENELTNMFIKDNNSKDFKTYCTKEMIFSDDFEIIYDSELTTLELLSLFGKCYTNETGTKLKRIIQQNQILEREYNIDL